MRRKGTDIHQLRESALELAAVVGDPEVGDETFDAYLEWFSRFHQYSAQNCLLIRRQRVDATYVASYRRWQGLGRQVNRGQKGIAIMVPMARRKRLEVDESTGEEQVVDAGISFGTRHVFDWSQTKPIDPSAPDEPPNFKPDVANAEPVLEAALEFAAAKKIEVDRRPLLGSLNGQSQMGRILINDSRPVGVQVQTIIHELAHEMLHDRDIRQASDRALIEGEAEATCVLVMRHMGFDVASNGAAYIRSHGATDVTILRSLGRIASTARELIEGITTRMDGASETSDRVPVQATDDMQKEARHDH